MSESDNDEEEEEGGEENDNTENDADNILNGLENTIESVLSYLPCGAHNIQLVVKDGLNLDNAYCELIKKISSHIVSRSKVSHLIAEEVRKLDKSLQINYRQRQCFLIIIDLLIKKIDFLRLIFKKIFDSITIKITLKNFVSITITIKKSKNRL